MMIELGHEIFIYTGPENDALCTKHVVCISASEQKKLFSERFPEFDPNHPGRVKFMDRVRSGLSEYSSPGDILCIVEGSIQMELLFQFPDLIPIEIGVGYEATCTERRAFESYSWMHYVYAKQVGRWNYFMDTVIPNAYDVDDFPLGKHEDDYMLYVGRLDVRKGIEVAIDVAKEIGCQLVIAGSGQFQIPVHKNIEFVGHVGIEQRAELMGNARCLIAPTLTTEPFGGTVVEAQLCGTPVLTTDWGAFVETVDEGVSGYRCRSLSEFVQGWESLDNLQPATEIKQWAEARYGTEGVQYAWADYLARVVGTPGPPHPPGSPQIPPITP